MSTPNPPPPPDAEDLRGLARGLRLLVEIGARTLTEDAGPSELALRVTGHLACELPAVVPVTERFPSWEHVNIQRGVDAYLAAQQNEAEWFGASGASQRPHEDILSIISMPSHFGPIRASWGGPGPVRIGPGAIRMGAAGDFRVGAASYGTAAIGPEENTEVVTFGLVTATAPDSAPVVIGIRDESRFGPPFCSLEILAAEQAAATATRDEIERLMRVHDVFRGQVLSFTASEHHGNELVTFLPRPAIAAQDVVLPDGMLENIERHILVSLRAGDRPPVLRGAHFAEVLAEMNSEHHALTRALLGAPGGPGVGSAGDDEPAVGEPFHPLPGHRPRPMHPRGR